MILGESPRKYGWDPNRKGVDQTSSANWETPGLNALSNAAEHFVPHQYRRTIAEVLTSTVEDPSNTLQADDYPSNHLFTDLKHKAIEVPNWNRGELDLEFTEESWETVIDDGNLEIFFRAIEDEIDVVTQCITLAAERPYDIIFTHFHYLDTIQHYFDEDTQRDWYGRTSELVESFCDRYPDRPIIIISDHGLGEYEHRPPGFVSVSNSWTDDLPESPTEVRAWLEEYFADEKEQNRAREEHLEDLGYLD